MKAGQRAVAYLRVSVVGDRAARGRLESPELQRDAIDGWCAPRGIHVVAEIRDLNRSAGTLTRPGLQQALEAVRGGGADGIVVARSDRASRRTLDALGLIDELEREGFWIAAADGTIDTTDRIRRMATTMHFAMAESELERFREQAAIVHRRAIVEKGRHMGPAPFGYQRGQDGRLQIDAEHAAVVRTIFARRADGAGWVQIARELDERGVRQRNGRRLGSHFLRRMVTRRVYLGEASHGDHVRGAAHPEIIDEALWAAAHRARPAVRSAPRGGREHPESVLRGLVRCAGCRYVLKRQPTGRGARWSCRTRVSGAAASHDCAAPVVVRQLEEPVLERIVVEEFMRLAGDVAAERADAAGLDALERRALEADALLNELSSLDVRRQLGAARWSRLVAEARDASEAAQRGVLAAQASLRSAGMERASLQDAWAAMGLSERQEALRSIVQAVMVVAGSGDIAGRVHVVAVWEAVDLPRKGSGAFVARPFLPGSG